MFTDIYVKVCTSLQYLRYLILEYLYNGCVLIFIVQKSDVYREKRTCYVARGTFKTCKIAQSNVCVWVLDKDTT